MECNGNLQDKSRESQYTGTFSSFTYKHGRIALAREQFLLLRTWIIVSITQGTPIHISDLINTLYTYAFSWKFIYIPSPNVTLHFQPHQPRLGDPLECTLAISRSRPTLGNLPGLPGSNSTLLWRFQQPPTSGLVSPILFELFTWHLKHTLRMLSIFS